MSRLSLTRIRQGGARMPGHPPPARRPAGLPVADAAAPAAAPARTAGEARAVGQRSPGPFRARRRWPAAASGRQPAGHSLPSRWRPDRPAEVSAIAPCHARDRAP